ncbi:collagen alpha-1(I) chain-like [Acinonyx jubatus]|uniref:Collagen alpha-1(I) chain-like n=1 Tax=Acinonyx jubatus TaxID=32536 RepID=A0ABM3NHL2_ACIJB|nr:collagen alpha-1(I) chain-like [Acinonyx jubatus]XP_053058909.1 collagen alpha-1(I) chain-like [Acinonyx jubatus]
MEAGPRGAQKLPEPREGAQPRAGAGGLRRPRSEAAARRPSGLRRRGGARGEEGRAAGPLRASPGRAGLPRPPGSRERAGRTQGEVSSCFPWLRRGGGGEGGLGRWPRARETVFFFFFFPSFKRRRCRPEERGRAGGRRPGWVGGGPHPRCPPRRNPPPPPRWAPARGPSPGPPDSSGRGGEAASERETEAGGGIRGPAGSRGRRGGQVGLEPRPLSPFPASLAHVGGSPPQSHFSLVPLHSPPRRGLQERAPLGQGLREPEEGPKERSWRPGFPANTTPPPPPPRMASWCPPCPHPLRLVWPGWRGWLWASDTLESPRSELRAWPPSQANSREEGGAA